MTYRITEKMLKRKVDLLNELTGNPAESWTKGDNGFKANIGNYHLSFAYGGVSLNQMMNDGGGVTDIFNAGHMPKRELFYRICAYCDGIETGQHPVKTGKAA